MTEHGPRVTKEQLRYEIRRIRSTLSESEYSDLSRRILENLQSLEELHGLTVLHSYWPVSAQREVDVRPFLKAQLKRGTRLIVPVVRSYSREEEAGGRLRHVWMEEGMALEPNRWGIPEPVERRPATPADAEAVIVPALAADSFGNRLGHGYGYYDEFLRTIEVPTICPVFECCLVEQVPVDSRDVPVDIVVTEQRILRRSAM